MLADYLVRLTLLDAITESFPIMIVDMDTSEIIYVSRPVEKLFGYAVHGELLGRHFECLIPEYLRDKHRQHVEEYNKNPSDRLIGLRGFRGAKKDGTVFGLEIGVTPAMISGRRCVVALLAQTQASKSDEERKNVQAVPS